MFHLFSYLSLPQLHPKMQRAIRRRPPTPSSRGNHGQLDFRRHLFLPASAVPVDRSPTSGVLSGIPPPSSRPFLESHKYCEFPWPYPYHPSHPISGLRHSTNPQFLHLHRRPKLFHLFSATHDKLLDQACCNFRSRSATILPMADSRSDTSDTLKLP